MSWNPAPVIGGAYSDDAKAWSCQDTVNWIPVAAERYGSRTPTMLRGAPGMRTFCITGSGQPIRGAHNVEGLLLVVSGTTLYRVSTLGAATALGTIPGVERVSMAHNQITGGSEVAIANGQGGYVYNTVTGTLTQITDDGFPGAISFDFCDGYIMGVEPGRRFAFHSQLAAAGDYNTLDRYEAEGSPDKLVGQIVTHREWWLFGERTIEPYVNTGEATGTFQRSSGTVIDVGAASRNAIVQMDNSVFWLGNDGVVYRAYGYAPQRISMHAIEQAISRCNLAQAFAFTFEDRGHKIFYLTFPDGMTWGYDAASGEWHRRKSDGLDRWRINTLTRWNGHWIAGDYTNGKLYELNWDVQDEDGAVLERRRVTGVLSNNQNRVTVDGVALVFDTGTTTEPKLLLPPLAITGHLPNGVVGEVVSYQYGVSGGVLPRAVSIVSGTLPAGLTMSASGLVTGTRTTLGSYAWTVRAVDADGTLVDLADTSATVDDINTAILADAPLLHWPLSEMSGTVANDLSGNGYDGTYNGGTLTGSGFMMTAYTDHVIGATGSSSGSPLDVGTGRQWAIEAVVTRSSTQPYDNVQANIAAQWISANFGYRSMGLSMPSTGKTATSFSALFTKSNLGGSITVASATAPVNDQRTSVIAERVQGSGNTDTMNIYIDGALSGTAAVSSTDVSPPSNGQQFTAGNSQISGYGWLGTVEHVAVYNHALGAARALYHAQLLGLA